LLLPNVALTNPATAFQLKGGEGATAAGMVVYNTSNSLDGPGGYVWDGSRWILITCVPETPGTIDLSPTAVNLNGTFTASVPEATGPAAPTSYAWALPTGLTGTSTTRTITITGAAGTYNAGTIKVAATNACGTSAEQTSAKAVTVRDCSAAPTVSSPASDQTPANQKVDAVYAMTVTANVYSASSVTYQWQSSANGNDWSNVSIGGNSNAYNAPTAAANLGTTYYRCKVTTTCGDAVFPKWKITVIEECSGAPTISSPASDETKITRQGVALPADLSVTAEGKGATPTYQWQSSADRSTWNPIGSATDATFTAPVANAGTTYYRCVVTTGCGSATSKVFMVIVCETAVEDSEGNWYCTGDFGTVGTWMTTNLRTKSSVPENINSGNANSAYYYPNKNSEILTSHPEYGLLYTWAAANIGTSATESSNAFPNAVSTRQGICPDGWHLPSDYEWNQLEQVIAESTQGVHSSDAAITWDVSATAIGYRGTHGQKMKSRTVVVNSSYDPDGTSNGLAANGFDALLVGIMDSGSALGYGTYTAFWSSSSDNSTLAWRRNLGYDYTGVSRTSYYKDSMHSVRCKKN
jgi:uncharacterized protein (TIGR02145 family)